jgi:predicted RNA methylase
MTKHIDEQTLAILSRVTVDGNTIFLTCGQLDRKQYQAVNEVLENIGGKWNRKLKGHVFEQDPEDALEQVLLTGEITPPKKYGYFPTPEGLARKIVDLAEIQSGHLVLEPSAGQGAIAGLVPKSATIDCIEYLHNNVSALERMGIKTIQADFLSVEPKPLYDRVVMNPPFEKQQDIDHVMHAWKCLKPGGRLVSIMSSGAMFRENRKTTEFRSHVDEFGYIERLPDQSFKESGTMVNTCFVVMDKPA